MNIEVHDHREEITFKDNGIGIEEPHKDEVFNLFTGATQRNVGIGLGLYMVKEAVDQMAGKIELGSRIGEGTKVKVILPGMN